MKKLVLLSALFLGLLFTACQGNVQKAGQTAPEEKEDTVIVDADQYVVVETSEGNITLKLYRDTPLHRYNFIKHAKDGYYNNQLFYRLVSNFMIQAGDPKSVNASRETALGANDVDYTIPAEIHPDRYYHKRGALGMASFKPLKESSGGHFYIITGVKHSDTKLFNMEDRYNKRLRKEVFDSITKPYSPQLLELQKKKNMSGMREIKKKITAETDKAMLARKQFHYTDEQKKQYQTVGGEASLDGFYTVFGEVLEGMDVVTKIEKRAVDANGRPYEDVRIKQIRVIDQPATAQ